MKYEMIDGVSSQACNSYKFKTPYSPFSVYLNVFEMPHC
jgi:hypothetical protein